MIYHETRPWGYFEVIQESATFKIKKIVVNPTHRLSYQYHQHRDEHWVVIEGTATVIINEEYFVLPPNTHIFIPRGAAHRVINNEAEPLVFIEVQTGDSFEETDIVRLGDAYDRV